MTYDAILQEEQSNSLGLSSVSFDMSIWRLQVIRCSCYLVIADVTSANQNFNFFIRRAALTVIVPVVFVNNIIVNFEAGSRIYFLMQLSNLVNYQYRTVGAL